MVSQKWAPTQSQTTSSFKYDHANFPPKPFTVSSWATLSSLFGIRSQKNTENWTRKKKVLFVDVDYKMIKVEKGAKNGEQK